MRTTWRFIHRLCSHVPMKQTSVNYVHYLFSCLYYYSNQTFYKDMTLFFTDIHLLLLRTQQIDKLLLVNFVERDLDMPFWYLFLSFLCLQAVKYMFEGIHYNSRTFVIYLVQNSHRVSFTSSRLSIDKEGSIIAIKNMVYKGHDTMFKNFILRTFLVKYSTEFEFPRCFCFLKI